MKKIYEYDFILGLIDKFDKPNKNISEEFLEMYNKIIKEDKIKPIFSQTSKYDLHPAKKSYKKFTFKTKKDGTWAPSMPKTELEKMKKTIIMILNKITEKNYNVLIETLTCEINKFSTVDVLEILVNEIINKIIFDSNFHDIYIKLCNRIWSMKNFHDELITIIIDENDKLYWYKNTSNDQNELQGPYDSEKDIRTFTNKYINFKSYLLDRLQIKFNQKDEFIKKSNEDDLDEEIRLYYRRNIFAILEFIGKLYRKKYIPDKIIHICLLNLINFFSDNVALPEEYIEGFSILWNNINSNFIDLFPENIVHQYFDHIQKNIMGLKWTLRIEFMLEDLVEKYKKKYKIKNNQKNKINNIENNADNTDNADNTENIENKDPATIEKNGNKSMEKIIGEIDAITSKFKKKINYDETAIKLQKYLNYADIILETILYSAIECDPKEQKIYIELIKRCDFIKLIDIKNMLELMINNLEEIEIDIPNVKKNLISFISYMDNPLFFNNILLTLAQD